MPTDNCFDVSTFERMFAGQLPAAEAEKVCEHLDRCNRCCQVVRNLPEDTLAASLRKNKWPANAVNSAFVHDLAQKVLKQGESHSQELSSVSVFSCPGCANKLKAKKDLAGQKLKCPKCGQMMQIPAKVPASASATKGDAAAAETIPPPNAARPSVAQTVVPMQVRDDRGLTEFLAPPQQPDEIGRLGVYRVLNVLGAGGMGVVYKAEDPGLKRLVAIKAMLPAIAASASAKARFLREAQAAAGIKHVHIVTIHQVGEDRGVPFLAMEFLEGEPLDERLKRDATLPLAEVLRIGREMAEGMAAAHERGLMHRDIKPANTWLEGKKGHVKIHDFGLARSTDDQARLTQIGAIIGTPAYMAPEQARGENVDARCDLWSLGVVLYRMCTGALPFQGTDTVSTLMAVATIDPPPPARINVQVPAGLSDLVMKLLKKEPAKRIASAQEVAATLNSLERGQKEDFFRAETVNVATSSAARRSSAELPMGPTELIPEQHPASPPKQVARKAVVAKKNLIATRPQGPTTPRRKWPVIAAAFSIAAILAAAIVFFWPTPHGIIRIEINDPEIECVLNQNGATFKGKNKQEISVTPDKENGLHIKRGDLEFDTDKFILKNGETVTLRIEWLKEGKLRVVQGDKVIAEKTQPLAKEGKEKDPQKTNAWAHLDISDNNEMEGFVHIPKGKSIATKDTFAGPIEITVVARMEGNETSAYDIRLAAFAGGMVFFNRADHPDELRVHRPDGDDVGKGLTSATAPFKPVAPNTWYTFKWRIDNQGMTVTVDDRIVYSETGKKYNFAAAKRQISFIAVGTAADVKSFEVKQLVDAATVAAYEKLGATYQPEIPAFRFSRFPKSKLPAVAVPFWLELPPEVTDDQLKDVATLENLSSLSLNGAIKVTDVGVRELAPLKLLTSLHLGSTQVTDAGLRELQTHGNLTNLNLGSAKITNAGLKELAPLKNLSTLELNYNPVTDVGLKELAQLKSLKSLSLYHTQVTDEGLRDLAPSIQLESLNLGETAVGDMGLRHLEGLTNLRELDLGATRVTGSGMASLKKLTKLQSLALGGTKISDTGLEYIGEHLQFRALWLHGTKITDVGMKHLAGLQELEMLQMHETAVTDTGLASLAGLSKLQLLTLGSNITDAGLTHLKGLRNLAQLDLHGPKITDAAIPHLTGLSNLRGLDLTNTKITAAGAREIRKALPKCEVAR